MIEPQQPPPPPPPTTTTSTFAILQPSIPFSSSLLMGEQIQDPIQIQPLTECKTENQPQIDTATTSTTTTTTTTSSQAIASTTTDQSIAPQHNPPPSTKIPSRPRKIQKLSPENTHGKSLQSVAAAGAKTPSTVTTKVPKKIVLSHPRPIQQIVARSLSCEGEIEVALRHLRISDPMLAPLIDLHQPPTFDSFHPPFLALTRSILYQQLAYKAGTSIYTRFVALCGGEAGVLPDTVLALTPHQLRQIGISGRKASYLHDLARKYQNGILSDSSIVEMDDKSLFTMLTMVNGIGSWSVHMFMIFSLHRPDVLPINDVGIRKGVQLLYGLEELPRPSQMDQLCEKWRPYRSVASWYLWRFVEAKGPPSSAPGVGSASLQQQQQDQMQQQQQQQHQQQFLDPINGILNLGACAWGQ